jgi:membrane protein implicated in regulation of membrane protease activity
MNATIKMNIPILSPLTPATIALVLEAYYGLMFLIVGFFDGAAGGEVLATAQVIGYVAMTLFSVIGSILAAILLWRSKSNKYLREENGDLTTLLESKGKVIAEKDLELMRVRQRKDELKEELIEEREEVLRLKGELARPKRS